MLNRLIAPYIKSDLKSKVVLLSGPRQSGKTTLAKALSESITNLNYDAVGDRKLITARAWDRQVEMVIFDELHKMKSWKSWIKGIYDTEQNGPALLVTGSARLDIARRMGDSLAGRHFSFRLHPLTLAELRGTASLGETFSRLMKQGGFPEPFLNTTPNFYERWSRSHLDVILRQDLLDLVNVRSISQIELLLELLRDKVGTPVSYQSLSEDLQVDISTVKRWLTILENLFVIFRVSPWSKNIARSILKTGKYYFYDNGQVAGDVGARFENLVATELLSALHFEQDTKGRKLELYYLRNKDGAEIDFALVEQGKLILMVEAKYSDERPSPAFQKFGRGKQGVRAIQLVAELDKDKQYPFGVDVRNAPKWLESIEL